MIHAVGLVRERKRSSEQHSQVRAKPTDASDKRRARIRKWNAWAPCTKANRQETAVREIRLFEFTAPFRALRRGRYVGRKSGRGPSELVQADGAQVIGVALIALENVRL